MLLHRATPLDVVEMLEDGFSRCALPAEVYKHLLVQVLNGAAWASRCSDGRILAIGGVFAFADRPAQAWFWSRPDLGRLLVPVVVQARRCLSNVADFCPHGVVAVVAATNGDGQRLARALGFRRVSPQIWEFAR